MTEQDTVQRTIQDLRRRWRTGEKESLSDSDLRTLEVIMKDETGFTFDTLHDAFLFRFSGAIVKEALNRDNHVITLPTGTRHLYALPGGRIRPEAMPFSALLFAQFWHDNRSFYEQAFGGDRSQIGYLKDRTFLNPLKELAKQMDMPFRDGRSNIRQEGYRELREELGLVTRRRGERDGLPVHIKRAVPIDMYLHRYRRAIPGSDEGRIGWFVSFNYLVDVTGNFEAVKEHVKPREAEGIRWVSLAEAARPGHAELYHDTVHYVAVRLGDLGLVNTQPRHGRYERSLSNDQSVMPVETVRVPCFGMAHADR
ncbi:hypothetical protein COV20_01100 [Candidatus Woesearchaeota archaeon CG10_big_fil_rev_8_21_14_0_10_45_16]|nr:MAG: hypothetical protein COV20_01100 [Candidatus Woesearchaeota archaeon CG10_big_fil_rev_8_21_14_0_10_45_16]